MSRVRKRTQAATQAACLESDGGEVEVAGGVRGVHARAQVVHVAAVAERRLCSKAGQLVQRLCVALNGCIKLAGREGCVAGVLPPGAQGRSGSGCVARRDGTGRADGRCSARRRERVTRRAFSFAARASWSTTARRNSGSVNVTATRAAGRQSIGASAPERRAPSPAAESACAARRRTTRGRRLVLRRLHACVGGGER